MTFFSPHMLWLLVVLPLCVLGYLWLLRRRNKGALRYSNVRLVKNAVGSGKWRRHVPPSLFLAAMGIAIFSVARPSAVLTPPWKRSTIILAMDVSDSMRASDIEPQRMVAAQRAAIDFVKALPIRARIGVVAFSSDAMTVQPPTDSIQEVVAAISRLKPNGFTAMGNGITMSLSNLFADVEEPIDPSRPRGKPLSEAPREAFTPVEPGSYTSAVIIVLTDGKTNVGSDPMLAAKTAADHGVRVFTVGFGTKDGSMIDTDGSVARVELDEKTLKGVADMTHGAYYRAGNQSELNGVYKTLTEQLFLERRKTELTAILAGLAALFTIFAATLSIMWTSRLV